ncbi:MAG: peptidoglycan bridge formation glycyltransferase FemA/FemB family protein [bacterium]
MEIKEINNKENWEKFLRGCPAKTFLNSWAWGEFQGQLGNKVWRLGIYHGEQTVGVALVTKIVAKRGAFLFLSHGPNLSPEADPAQALALLLEYLKKLGQKEKVAFLRVSSLWERQKQTIFKELNFRTAPIHINPDLTWKLDISPSEEELFTKVRKTTRYLIRQAEKNPEVEIVQSRNIDDVLEFNKVYQETVNRQHFTPFSLDYLKKEFSAFDADNQISIFLGKYKGEIVSAAMIIFWQGLGFYHQGASLLKYPKIPVSYLLQWEAIREAKRRGCRLYNFWGIAPLTEGKKHPWAGLTLFKKGFGGFAEEYVKTQDFIFSNKYWLNWAVEKLRSIKRGY